MSPPGPFLVVVLAAAAGSLAWPTRLATRFARSREASAPRGARPRWRAGGRREERAARADLADLLALLAAPLRAGVAPGVAVQAALSAAGPVHPRLDELVTHLGRRVGTGDGLAGAWLAQAAALGSADLQFVGQAWLLTERTGAPLAPALVEAERVLRARARAEARLDAVAAGPRASMAVLAVLPLSGPLVGAAFGLSPGALYLASPLAVASGLLGVGLALFGWWWGRRILARALDPPRHP